MKIASVSGVKNEADVIESFVRLNSKFIDHFYFIDDSVDSTRQVLKLLAGEGFNISIIAADTRDYQHSHVVTNAVRLIAKAGNFDWIFPLDADEIIHFRDKESFCNALTQSKPGQVGVMQMVDYGFNGEDYFASKNPLKECFNRFNTNVTRKKVFLRAAEAHDITISTGQHDALDRNGRVCAYFEPGFELAHFPGRAENQWVVRTIVRYVNLISKLNRFPGEGSHVIDEFERLKIRNFTIEKHDLFNANHLSNDGPQNLPDIECRYQSLWYTNERLIMALELERQAKLLGEFRQAIHSSVTAAENISGLKALLSI
jgi:Glycosyl transferase family 2